MKLWVFILISFSAFSQQPLETSIFLFDIRRSNDSVRFENPRKISENKGYNNQPSFYDNNRLLYAGATGSQTQIASYDLRSEKTEILTDSQGSEFSPHRIPEKDDIAAVRLDPDGTQKLYRYDALTGQEIECLSDLKVGYFSYFTSDELLAAVVGNGMDLWAINTKTKQDSLIITQVGRSLHRIPNTNSMSYSLINENGGLDIYLLDLDDKMSSYYICTLPRKVEDYTWLNNTQLVAGNDNRLVLYDTIGEAKWVEVSTMQNPKLRNITRFAVSPDGKTIAVVAQLPGS